MDDQKEKSVKQTTLQRNTIILRDIPADVTEEEIKNMFKGELLEFLEDLKPEIADTYFIKFRDEESALKAFKLVKSQTFRGKPIQGRMKAENLSRSYYYVDPAVAQNFQPVAPGVNPYAQVSNNYKNNNNKGYGDSRNRFNRRGQKNDYSNNQSNETHTPNSKQKITSAPITTSFWPPLQPGSVQETNSGFGGEFKKYSKEQIVAVLSNIKEKPNPQWESINNEAIREGEPLMYSEILRAVPKDARVEWIVSSRRRSSNPPHNNTQKQNSTGKDYKSKALKVADAAHSF
jgi:hypothetical protein